MRIISSVIISILFCLSFFICSVKAEVLGLLPLKTLVVDADLIVVGTAEKIEGKRISGRGEQIFTEVTFIVEKYIKNNLARDKIGFYYFGGCIGDICMTDPDWPNPLFKVGERAIVFLKREGDSGNFFVYGMGEGVIKEDNLFSEKILQIEGFLK